MLDILALRSPIYEISTIFTIFIISFFVCVVQAVHVNSPLKSPDCNSARQIEYPPLNIFEIVL